MKNTSTILSCMLALLGLALACGCETAAPGRHPRQTTDCVLDPRTPAPDVDMEIQSAIRMVLPGPAEGSGLVWEIAANNAKVLEQMGRLTRAPAGPGGIATSSVSFYSLKPGRSVVRFVLVRADQRETEPVAMCRVIVHVRD